MNLRTIVEVGNLWKDYARRGDIHVPLTGRIGNEQKKSDNVVPRNIILSGLHSE